MRGRLGWLAAPSLLTYGTGGFAYGGVKAATNASATFGGPDLGVPVEIACTEFVCNPSTNSDISETRTGWTAGGGFEWMFAQRMSVKLEYLYYDLGRVTYNSLLVSSLIGQPGNLFVNNVQTSTRFNGNIVRAGVNWYFW